MSSDAVAAGALPSRVRPTRWPRTVIFRFVSHRIIRSATFAALAFGTFTASKTIGYVDVYSTAADRVAAAALLSSNVGFKALFGTPYHVETAVGYASWYGVTMGVLIGSIWAYLIATKTLRGEEAAGRWELLLAGQTTPRKATAQALAGIGVGLAVFYDIASVSLILIGRAHNVGYGTQAALFFALAATAGAVMFAAVGAFASQIMATRARAAGFTTAVFGVAFLLRAAADITSAHWLLNFTPIGWVEKLHPLVGSQSVWLLPIVGFICVLVAATIYLAGRRDLGASFVKDQDTALPRLALLGNSLGAAWRLTWPSVAAWTAGITAYLTFFGALTNSATQVFTTSDSAQQFLDRLTGTGSGGGARIFLGVAFWLFMTVVMAFGASAVGSMRADEADGYLDHMLTRSVSRMRWLRERLLLVVGALLLMASLAILVVWATTAGHPTDITLTDLAKAAANALPPAFFVLGVSVAAFGLRPRMTTIVGYGTVVWSFAVQLLSSGTTLNHWLLDTSIFYHVSFAPAAEPKWSQAIILSVAGLALMIMGAVIFNRRDLANE